jgi:hypothetical protein
VDFSPHTQCREIYGLKSTYLPALETTHTQIHDAATSLIVMEYS